MEYEKILKGIVQIINTTEKSDIGFANICTYIGENCPELKESEDERIRKALINHFTGYETCTFNGIPSKEVIAWLEKQGEQKSIINVPSRNVILSIWDLGNEWKELTNGSISTEYGTQLNYIQKHWHESEYYLKEKLDEKPTDKVIEPKFHEGEWVVNNTTLNLCHILKVEHGQYICSDCSFPITKDNEYHLWTIEDAKVGDVLNANGAPFIYKKHDKNYVYFYCGINLADAFIEANNIDTWNSNSKVYPATKEQRDLLFSKMKEAGYEWDAEKKELRKIEKQGEQKPKWSDEDEELLQHCCGAVAAADYYTLEDKEEMENWLESLKKRMGV